MTAYIPHGSLLHAGLFPTCSDGGTEFVTPVYAVVGFDATFHCPCIPPNCLSVWQVNQESPTFAFNQALFNSTHLSFPSVSDKHLGSCVVCQRRAEDRNIYLLYNITEVAALGGGSCTLLAMCGMDYVSCNIPSQTNGDFPQVAHSVQYVPYGP